MKIISINNTEQFLKKIATKNSSKNQKIVESILKNVKNNGDAAVKKYEKKFGANISSLRVSQRDIASAYSKVSKEDIYAIKLAKSRLSKAELAVRRQFKDIVIKSNGTKISKSFVPIDSVGCYVPGGAARYPSSAIMSVTPAKIAGVKRIVVVSPPNSSGNIDPLTIVASDICGATEIYKTGGAQSIAALAYGTRSIKKVDKIVGPGGAFVTLAKYLVSNLVSIDMMAGPTELGVVIDSATDADLVALDLISQAEHSADTFCYALTPSNSIAKKIQLSVNSKLKDIQRANIVKSSLESNGFIGVCKTSGIIDIVNNLAPEHLEIISKNTKKWSKIKNPGLILSGKNSPSSASDYLLGSNHILPTNGFGKTRGSLSVLDFVKLLTKIETSRKDLQKISKSMKNLTLAEGLPNHYEAVRGRLK
ncbi:histidinol dehydrogenase [Candidatus Nitrosopumilus sp. SW]|uniref:histidinol dehydrogenase n=1 Tax=Candidatus Nitrosopumilus sp. SW TaxID=2508726 RepID=UPI001154260B|nr:histidinol dehydrogenase [Candidatus Nitrosopumilus sp. SW]QDI89128.1 histidinol dehydrogenase [Candidatus Nitrosopumilus sp. SW]